MRRELIGIGVAEGSALGPAVIVRAAEPAPATPAPGGDGLTCFAAAVAAARAELTALVVTVSETVGSEQAAILAAQCLVLDDPALIDETRRRIVAEDQAPLSALAGVRDELAALFRALDDPTLRGRLSDLDDVVARLRRHLSGASSLVLPERAFVLVGDELPPSLVAGLDRRFCRALVSTGGGPTGHVAIIARSLALPAVVGVAELLAVVQAGDLVAVDGATGRVIVQPSPAEQATFGRSLASAPLRPATPGPVLTLDGQRIEVAANIDGLATAERALALGAESIGLFRTELLFMGRAELPSEAEQVATYAGVGRLAGERLVIIRTLDIGGDKAVPALGLPVEPNPFLGQRGLRLCLARPALFRSHLRAILRASLAGRFALLLPMVTGSDEVEQARAFIDSVRAELLAEGVPLGEPLPLGVMIETPAAALMADHLAPMVDFFSVGSNDLSQYTLAADRGNPVVAGLADPYHPAVLRLLQHVVEAGHAAGRWVGICGELASQPAALSLLVGLGFDELSCNPAAIPLVVAALRSLRAADARRLAARAVAAPSAAAVTALLAGQSAQ